MPMNEYGEIVRTPNQSLDNDVSGRNGYESLSSDISKRFRGAKRKNFNIITLIITIPLYIIIGYYIAEYLQINEFTESAGATVGGILSLICVLIYNNKFANKYEGYEYLVSILFPAIIAVAIALIIGIGYLLIRIAIEIIKAVIIIILIFAILAGLAGG